ncbi:MAG TPA: hypothetical protein VH231_04115 [Solirubrobacteraceae bacterium]|nr:hypothetical protein [Solirubrobacteraceae bacterium]
MAKRDRENAVRERRLRKQAKKAARKQAAAQLTADVAGDTPATDEQVEPSTDVEPTA